MTDAFTHGEMPEGDDVIAAEYALGLLSLSERANLASRIEHDQFFARLVQTWEERLHPLSEGYQSQELPKTVKAALDGRLFGVEPKNHPASHWWSSLALWRAATAITALALLLTIALPELSPPSPTQRLVAQLTTESGEVTYLAVYDSDARSVSLAHLKGTPSPDHVFELWIAKGTEAPISLGILADGRKLDVAIDAKISELMTNAAHMAISLEPAGGSPTGQPTGPIQALGDLLNV
jgi:anti-sigma-K factor RskA